VAAEHDTPQRQRSSHTALPVISPPASRMRVTTVASVLGVQFLMTLVPSRHGTPLSAMLSLACQMCSNRVHSGILSTRSNRDLIAIETKAVADSS
jgi:hypothetical protein